MLSTIIYRSHIADHVPVKSLDELAIKANKINQSFDVTGILLFNGTHFFQLLEGPERSVNTIYQRIGQDPRHHNLVELMRDYAPARRFGNLGMELFDLRKHDKASVLSAVLDKGTSKYQLTYDDRALRFLRTFVEAREKENYFEIPAADSWEFICEAAPTAGVFAESDTASEMRFAFQPVVDPFAREIVSLEALSSSVVAEAHAEHYSATEQQEIYLADLNEKKQIFSQAKKLGIEQLTLSVNLLPMSLVEVPDAVNFLLNEIHANGLIPEQIVVEFTENEIISRLNEFEAAVKQLKAAGISLALGDFGAGFAGLSLLTRFQPDKIKIDRNIISGVHKSGPKQAIIHAILKCCSSLEISVIAEGIEQPEEWMWLEAAGVANFQGLLFAAPQINGIAEVAWPELK